MKNRYIFAVLMCGLAIISGCQKDELENIPEGAVMLTAEGFHGDGSKTSVRGNTVQWVNNDQVKFNNADPVYVIVTGDDKAYVSSVPSTNPLYAYYPADLAVGTYQSDNTNITLPAEYTSSYDGYRNQELHLPMVAKVTGANPSTIEFKHLTAAVKVTVKNMAGVDVTLDSVVITSNSLQFSGTRSVTIGEGSVSVAAQAAGTPALADRRVRVSFSESPTISSGATKEVQVPFWPVAATTGTGDFTINVYTHDGSDKYFLHKNGTSPELARNQMLTANVSIGNNVIDLSTVSSAITVENGQILTGTLANNVKISIADDATVTLDGVTINGTNNSSYKWAGLNCLGDATVILADGSTNSVKGFYCTYPGIHIPSGYTLTIQGTGELNASSYDGTNGGAGIGGGWQISCGNITITSGTVTATGKTGATGIGGACYNASCGNITISGGTITATGGSGAPGIGTGKNSSGGNITISGGTVTANGGSGGAGIGSGSQSHCNAITISGGTITASSASSGAGIGSGSSYASCGVINITGGTVEATGGIRAAGIGSGYTSCSCGDITITNGVTSVTATRGEYATYSIGAGVYNSTCGTVTIGGVTGAISTSPYTYEPLPEGALSGKFTINSSGGKVRFSQGNLQAVGTTSSSPSSGWTWQFAEHQYDYIGGRSQGGSEPQTGNNYINGNGTLSADGTVDLFCWSTNATYYGIHNGDNSSTYSGDFYDWGNAIGSGWRTLTPAEWEWILGPSGSPTPGTNCRTSSTVNGVANARYAKATVVGKAGLIIFPDSYTHPGDATAPASVNTANAAYNSNSYDATAWGKMEAAGAVFLPAAGNSRRVNENNIVVADSEFLGFYWSTVPYVDAYNDKAYQLVFFPDVVEPSGYSTKNLGFSVRLVKDVN